MPAVAGTLAVAGLAELQRAFKAAENQLDTEFATGAKQVAEPVRVDAERLAVAGIPRIGVPWSRMRVGVTTRSVYVAPEKRGSRIPQRRRPNLADLLLGRAMEPALQQNEGQVLAGFERILDNVGKAWENA